MPRERFQFRDYSEYSETISNSGVAIYRGILLKQNISKKYNFNRMMERVEKFINELDHAFNSVWGIIAFAFTQCIIFFSPVRFNIYLAGGLIIFDIITALIALFLTKSRESKSLYEAFSKFYSAWTSNKAFDSVPKFLYYSLLVFAGYGVGVIFQEPMHCANLATGLIIYIEFRSILENSDRAFGTSVLPLVTKFIRDKFLSVDDKNGNGKNNDKK